MKARRRRLGWQLAFNVGIRVVPVEARVPVADRNQGGIRLVNQGNKASRQFQFADPVAEWPGIAAARSHHLRYSVCKIGKRSGEELP
jgi:hypothetical protein